MEKSRYSNQTLVFRDIIAAQGGIENWSKINKITLTLSFGGLAFLSRFKTSGWQERRVHVELGQQSVRFDDFPRHGYTGYYTPDRVWIDNEYNTTIAENSDSREKMKRFKSQLFWSQLDLLYFAGYAIWNYTLIPYLFLQEGFKIVNTNLDGVDEPRYVEIEFPDHIHSHCRMQKFYLNNKMQIYRHDYDPEVYASWAKAAHFCDKYIQFDDILLPIERYVVPRGSDGKAAKGPRLVWISIKHVSISYKSSSENLGNLV
ncbi:MAG: hypothetical protein KDD94_06240 [Calditrichaeota bacterium]|nr:hypothetical protein [Calditrichota bacterium]